MGNYEYVSIPGHSFMPSKDIIITFHLQKKSYLRCTVQNFSQNSVPVMDIGKYMSIMRALICLLLPPLLDTTNVNECHTEFTLPAKYFSKKSPKSLRG